MKTMSIVLSGTLLAAGAQPPAPIPLTVERTEVVQLNLSDGPKPAIAVIVRNTATQAIDALGVDVSVTYPDGVTRRTGSVTDCRLEARPVCGEGLVQPGGTYTMNTGLELPQLSQTGVSLTAQPSFAILADNSAVGVGSHIDWAFRQRAGALKTWEIVEQRTAAPRPPDATPESILRDLLRDLAAERSINGTNAYGEMSAGITSALGHRAGRDPVTFLSALTADAPARRQAAQAHAVQKP